MAFFEWKDKFSVGIDEIDNQHRTFLGYLNECYHQVSVEKKTEIAPELIDRLKAYAAKHFRFEEDMLRSKKYPDLAAHREQHIYFEDQVFQLETTLSTGSGSTAKKTLSFLRDWFLEHILDLDRKYAVYLN
jgi:hemerythrin